MTCDSGHKFVYLLLIRIRQSARFFGRSKIHISLESTNLYRFLPYKARIWR